MSIEQGKLYVVATPIGNLDDLSFRAVTVLKQVDLIAAEDTRHIQALLKHFAIRSSLVSFHQHNEEKITLSLIEKIRSGCSVALVSDAGTPLISDPGLPLVRAARCAGLTVVPIPGACAAITALSVSGLPVNRFIFEGFLPRTPVARRTFLEQRKYSPVTWVVYESCHRISDTVKDMAGILPEGRQVVIARELTKLYETIVSGTARQLLAAIEAEQNMRKGEFVLIVDAHKEKKQHVVTDEQQKVLALLLSHCSVKTAVTLTQEIAGGRKKALYQMALSLSQTS